MNFGHSCDSSLSLILPCPCSFVFIQSQLTPSPTSRRCMSKIIWLNADLLKRCCCDNQSVLALLFLMLGTRHSLEIDRASGDASVEDMNDNDDDVDFLRNLEIRPRSPQNALLNNVSIVACTVAQQDFPAKSFWLLRFCATKDAMHGIRNVSWHQDSNWRLTEQTRSRAKQRCYILIRHVTIATMPTVANISCIWACRMNSSIAKSRWNSISWRTWGWYNKRQKTYQIHNESNRASNNTEEDCVGAGDVCGCRPAHSWHVFHMFTDAPMSALAVGVKNIITL